ncbi:anhydro-N-acetylmuramic acid kinase [Pleionea sediminis]|uniref:anhydro-N-acetylmuramic acid kinase n=1 Tax=Pleionea sediminis TaxID=2569479 RepID=UPI00118680E2|nr:anhydro-N-acetylmuramic acid kinase [Pleionea sediminis]
MSELYIGLISGTSADGIDAVVLDFSNNQTKAVAEQTYPYPEQVREEVLSLSQPLLSKEGQRIDRQGHLDHHLGKLFAEAARNVCKTAEISMSEIVAIGSHGQTIRHRPQTQNPFSLQLADPNVIAWETQCVTIADFRRIDIAAGGQGAPLVPLFHQQMYQSEAANRVILNLGGIANITWLPKDGQQVIGFDTGPANALCDYWIEQHQNNDYDVEGAWARSGQTSTELLKHMLADPYFQLPAPKSTGREYFDAQWLQQKLKGADPLPPEDVQSTLAELSAQSIARHINKLPGPCEELLVCGGGIHNHYLIERIEAALNGDIPVNPLNQGGLNSDFVEAATFAWLARERISNRRVDYRSITGSNSPLLMGAVYHP